MHTSGLSPPFCGLLIKTRNWPYFISHQIEQARKRSPNTIFRHLTLKQHQTFVQPQNSTDRFLMPGGNTDAPQREIVAETGETEYDLAPRMTFWSTAV